LLWPRLSIDLFAESARWATVPEVRAARDQLKSLLLITEHK
jgi:hypothetical protein